MSTTKLYSVFSKRLIVPRRQIQKRYSDDPCTRKKLEERKNVREYAVEEEDPTLEQWISLAYIEQWGRISHIKNHPHALCIREWRRVMWPCASTDVNGVLMCRCHLERSNTPQSKWVWSQLIRRRVKRSVKCFESNWRVVELSTNNNSMHASLTKE